MGSRHLVTLGMSALILFVCLAGSASAKARFDGSFGGRGFVTTSGPMGVPQGAAAAKDRNGRLLVVGGSERGFLVARYLGDGRLDPSFGQGGIAEVAFEVGGNPVAAGADAVLVQPDGKILVGGSAGDGAALARLDPDGALDTGFGGSAGFGGRPGELMLRAHRRVLSIALQGRRILLAGAAGVGWVGRFTATGRLDRGFGPKGGWVQLPPAARSRHPSHVQAGVTSVRAVGSGRIFAAGYANGDFLLARLDPDGRLDRGFAGRGMIRTNAEGRRGCRCSRGEGFARDRHGRLLVSGYVAPGTRRRAPGNRVLRPRAVAVARYRPNGRLDLSFGRGGIVRTRIGEVTEGHGVAVQPNGRIVVAASAEPNVTGAPRRPRFAAVRYLASGRRDRSFFGDGILEAGFGALRSVAWDPLIDDSGRLVLSGEADPGGEVAFREERLLVARFRG